MNTWKAYMARRILASLFLAALSVLADPSRADVPASGIRLAATVVIAGPYGEMWQLTVSESGAGTLKISSAGSRQAKPFRVSNSSLSALRAIIREVKFGELPDQIAPRVLELHRPDLRLGVRLDGRSHSVALYDPGSVNTEAARRFMRVWKAVFQLAPKQPKW